jgi:phosphodiesterase/alkaline phosphatase D-like protein
LGISGGVTSTSANFRVRGPARDDGIKREFVLSTHPNLAIEKNQLLVTPVSYEDFVPQEHFVKSISIDSLSPVTTYYYGITHPQSIPNSATMVGDVGTFSTPPPDGTRVNFTIATGACSLTGSRSGMFANVLDLNPVLFIHTGDFHYEDLDTLDIDERLEAYDKVMGSDSQRLLYMRTIFTYMWDDHDWLGNNKDSTDKEAANIAKTSYSLGIPHYQLGAIQSGASNEDQTAPKYQAFTIGTVRFIISDLRSESIKSTDEFEGQIYSAAQKNWLYNELAQAASYDFVIWVTSRPWTDPDEIGSDSWGGFVSDRDDLASFIASTIGAGPKNLLVLSGDNHMVAFDDGSSTDYSNQNQVRELTYLYSS